MTTGRKDKDIYDQHTYVELAFENLLSFVYGSHGAGISAGWTSLPYFKKSLLKLFKTLRAATERNIHGDEAHRAEITGICESAIETIGRAKTKDEVTQWALNYTFHMIFLLLGRFPKNWRKTKAGWQSNVALSEFRTLAYIRTPKQKVAQVLAYAYQHMPAESEDSEFSRIIAAKQRHPHDESRVLAWIRSNEPKLYARFNKA